MADRTGLDSKTLHKLPDSTASYGGRTQTRTFKNHANLLACLSTVHSREWLLRHYKTPSGPFLSFAQAFCTLIVQPEWAPTKAWLRVVSITQLWAWAH